MLNELVPGIFWMAADHTTDRPIIAAIAGETSTLMVDACSSSRHAQQFLGALAAHPVPLLRYVVLTHSHWDHVFGAADIDAIAIATEETQRHLATMATWSWSDAALDERVASGLEIPFCREMMKAELNPAERAGLRIRTPDLTFRTELAIELGHRTVRIVHVGGDHASDSCVVVVPGVAAFLGDCVYQNLHVEPNYLTRRHTFPLLDRLLGLDVSHYVLGHADEPMSRDEFASMAHAMKIGARLVEEHQGDDQAIGAAISNLAADEDAESITEYAGAFRAGLAHEVS